MWAKKVEAAKGQHQSPINIIPTNAKFDNNLNEFPLDMAYNPSSVTTLINDGHTIQVFYDPNGSCKYISTVKLSNK